MDFVINSDMLELSDAQYIDNSGKCRALHISKYGVTIFIPPIAPLNLGTISDIFKFNKKDDLLKLKKRSSKIEFKFMCGKSSHGSVVYDGVVGEWDGITFFARTKSKIVDGDIAPYFTGFSIPQDTYSSLKNHEMYRKISIYLREYAIYEMALRKTKNLNDVVIIKTGDDVNDVLTEIVDNFDLLQPNFLSEINREILFDRKSNKLLLTPMIYRNIKAYIEIKMSSNSILLEEYISKISIPEMFDKLTDFKDPSTIIVGESAALKYTNKLTQLKSTKVIHNKFIFDRIPYYFFNSSVNNGGLYIVQNVKDLKTALIVLNVWNESRINIADDTNAIKILDEPNIKYTILKPDSHGHVSEVYNDKNIIVDMHTIKPNEPETLFVMLSVE